MRLLPLVCWLTGFAALLPAQDLRRALVGSDAIVVGRQVGKKPHGDSLALHRVQVLRNVRGAAEHKTVTVLDWPKLSLHNRPTPRQSRLFCLQDASATAKRLGLPSANGPYFKLVGWSGSHPLVGKDLDQDPFVRFATVLANSENGTSSSDTANALVSMAIGQDHPVRTEITRFLAERGHLRGKLSSIHWNQLVARATGEVENIDYKIALAELCAEQRIEGLVDALAVSLGPVTDVRYARCVGRIAKLLHGEQATDKFVNRLRNVGQAQDRKMLLLAMGASNTKSALDALMRMSKTDQAVNAALREHRSKQAREAVVRRKKK